jgi:hypothetical protein
MQRAGKRAIARIGAWDIARGCTSKRQYKDRGAAVASARVLGLRVYECPFCTWWHLTSGR